VAGRVYVDTSVYLCVLLRQQGHAEWSRALAGAELLSSVLLILEAERNLIRQARDGALPQARLQDALDRVCTDVALFQLRDLTLDLCAAGAMLVVSTPRSLDLVHLRTALWFHAREPLTRFATQDAEQLAAARELGLPVQRDDRP
jgi:hypothetical protein